jgi:hypothetical protein
LLPSRLTCARSCRNKSRSRYDCSEEIWLSVVQTCILALQAIVGVQPKGIAITDLRFLIEMRGLKELGGKILHIEAADQQANVAPELRGHRSEVELDSPEVRQLRDAYIFNRKDGGHTFARQGWDVLRKWDWL